MTIRPDPIIGSLKIKNPCAVCDRAFQCPYMKSLDMKDACNKKLMFEAERDAEREQLEKELAEEE